MERFLSPITVFLCSALFARGIHGIHIEFSSIQAAFAVNETVSFTFNISQLQNVSALEVELESKMDGVLVEPSEFHLVPNDSSGTGWFTVRSLGAGKTALFVSNSSLPIENASRMFIQLMIYNFKALEIISLVVGWTYFVSWSVGFYPQMYQNYRRKSVAGFSLDYVSLNMIGHTSYFFFNVGLYWIPSVQDEYFAIHQFGVNPVLLNDVLFSVHATFATFIHCVQCLIYDRGGQTISKIGRCLIVVILTFLVICLILSIAGVVTWLQYLYYFSYVKLAITFLKYCPQAYMNYRRKSTEGWSIGFACSDFVGGTLSILQMILIAINYDDWGSITGDPSKFGLGAVSVAFDVIFMIQHFCLYRSTKEPEKAIVKMKGEPEKKGLDNPAFMEAITHM